MISVKLKFRPSSVDGKEGRLYYQLTYMRKVRRMTTDYRILQSEWDSVSENIVMGFEDSSRRNYLISVKNKTDHDIKCFKRIINKMTMSDVECNVDNIVNEFQRHSHGVMLFPYMDKLISDLWSRGQYRTSETYQSTLNSFRKYRKGVDVYLDDIDSDMLVSYEYHLKTRGLSPNTISFYMKRLRAVYNDAAENEYVDNRFPFKKVFTSSEKTLKRAIPIKLIRELKNMDLSYSASKCFARDMFLFSFYTRGMSFVDIAYLQKKNLKDGILTYRRKKTGQLLSIRWESCMQKIVDKYSSLTSPFLLSIIKDAAGNTRKQYSNTMTLVNRKLKEIAKDLGWNVCLTMYVARHSWASIAREQKIPLSVISEAMGHDSERTTQIYLASLETHVIDDANRKILRLL